MVAFSSLATIFWRMFDHLFPACAFFFFFCRDQLAHTKFTLYAGIGPRWLSDLRRLRTNVPLQVVCELRFRIGSHTMPGQHSQPTPTSLGHERMGVYVYPAKCTFGRMTGVSNVLLR